MRPLCMPVADSARCSRSRCMGLEFSHPLGPCRRLRQERRLSRCPRCSRIQPHRARHGDAAAATRQPEAAHVPRAGRAALVNRMGFNNKGVDHLVERLGAPATAESAASASARMPTRPSSGRRRTTSPACARCMRTRITSPSTYPRRTPRACASCRRPTACERLSGALLEERAPAREAPQPNGCRCWSRSPPTSTQRRSRALAASLRSFRDRRRDRHQHDHRSDPLGPSWPDGSARGVERRAAARPLGGGDRAIARRARRAAFPSSASAVSWMPSGHSATLACGGRLCCRSTRASRTAAPRCSMRC